MSKKRKGMSADDKLTTILKIYHDKLEPFNLKEIENLASKAGVVLQTVKDVNQMLVDDSLVNSDKIGAANIFWSFPSKMFKDQQLQQFKLQKQIEHIQKSCQTLNDTIDTARAKRCSSDRASNMKSYVELQLQIKHLDEQLKIHKNNDPVEIEKVQSQAKMCKESADRWVDNLLGIKKYLTKKKGMSGKEVHF
jgi:hypothetical protein